MSKIPWFRSGKVWKKIFANFGYLMIILIVVSVTNGCANNDKTSPVSTPIKQETKQNQVPINSTPTVSVPISTPEKTANPTISPPTVVAPVVKTESVPKQTNQEITVYGTKTGSKYHNDGCRYLSKSKISMTLSDAKSSGLTPCSVCNPPQ